MPTSVYVLAQRAVVGGRAVGPVVNPDGRLRPADQVHMNRCGDGSTLTLVETERFRPSAKRSRAEVRRALEEASRTAQGGLDESRGITTLPARRAPAQTLEAQESAGERRKRVGCRLEKGYRIPK